jgi:hypothetical protein
MVTHASVQSFSVDSGNVSRFRTPVCNLFQWMLEISQASPPECANFFSGCWKCLELPNPSVQTFSVDAGNVSSFPTPVCKLFELMLVFGQALNHPCTKN